jgi:hypothetical protein
MFPDKTIHSVVIDESVDISKIIESIGKKFDIKNSEEFKLQLIELNLEKILRPSFTLAEEGVNENDILLLTRFPTLAVDIDHSFTRDQFDLVLNSNG